jgi:putative ABC transport system permease protein
MRKFQLAIHHIMGRPLRSALTVIGISIACAGSLAVTGLIQGVQDSLEQGMEEPGADFMVGERASFSLVGGSLPESLAAPLMQVPGVEQVSGVLFNVETVDNSGNVVVSGWPRESFLWKSLDLAEGQIPAADETRSVVLGQSIAGALKKTVGDEIEIRFTKFRVVGIARFSSYLNQNIALVPLEVLQEFLNRQGSVTFFQIRLTRPIDTERIAAIRMGLTTAAGNYAVFDSGEFTSDIRLIRVIRAVADTISAIMLGLALVLVATTLLMAVNERTYEIGVLAALGWSDFGILSLIVLEGVLITTVGALLGLGLGFLVMQVAADTDMAAGYLRPYTNTGLVLRTVLLTIAIGTLGALYPAWRATRLDPAEALRRQ